MSPDVLHFSLGNFANALSKEWERIFTTTWKTCKCRLSDKISKIARHRSLIESRATPSQVEESQRVGQREDCQRDQEMDFEQESRFRAVYSWLNATSIETDQYYHSKIRSEYPGSGRWLLDNATFKEWFDPQFPTIPPLLWLNGIPGAGN